jgi:Holliday junction DNA helicase RuvA
MIGLLRGKLLHKQAPDLLLDVGGVGYELLASMTTFFDLPEINNEVTLYTHLIVREDAHTLYAFSSVKERALFRVLLKVNGVGPKMALAIVSGMTAEEFAQRVHANDVTGLTKLPGVGKKTAERLIIEMRDRLAKPSDNAIQGSLSTSTSTSVRNLEAEAVEALVSLGYKPTQATQMVGKFSSTELSVEEIIRKALKASLS